MDGRQLQGRRTETRTSGLFRNTEVVPALDAALAGLPALEGPPITLGFGRQLSIAGGKLRTDGLGTSQVHAATFLKKREMVLDRALLDDPSELRRIVIHEIFHFVWWRLGNVRRGEWDTLLQTEFDARARGELGWSSEWRKQALAPADRQHGSRRWREYRCESFCDSASALFSGHHPEFTLARRFRLRRIAWMERLIGEAPLSI